MLVLLYFDIGCKILYCNCMLSLKVYNDKLIKKNFVAQCNLMALNLGYKTGHDSGVLQWDKKEFYIHKPS